MNVVDETVKRKARGEVERLLAYGVAKGLIDTHDTIEMRNYLLEVLQLDEPSSILVPDSSIAAPDTGEAAVAGLVDYAVEAGIIADTSTYRDLFDTRLMGLLTPRSSQVIAQFQANLVGYGMAEALDRYYRFSQDTLYIRAQRIAKNIAWVSSTRYGNLQITINLAKPEKDPRDIAAARQAPASGYPKCVLCLENAGYAGRVNHPARQNHRVLPMLLCGQQWFFQYSPYVYYHQHCIVFRQDHVPMEIGEQTFSNFFAFLRQVPHYFIGSNADLPIVGGSILSHDHYQGGFHQFPMETAQPLQNFAHSDYALVEAATLNWPLSTLRLRGPEPDALVSLATGILTKWREYEDPELGILAASASEGQKVERHNTITPIARRAKDGRFELDLVLRNNRTNREHPLGIFHPHSDLHHIKKENIGLIEVMGLAILPGRLQTELAEIAGILTGRHPVPEAADGPLKEHWDWIQELLAKYQVDNESEAMEVLKSEVGAKFARVLEDAGVFKLDEPGQSGFARFLVHCGFSPVH